MHLLRYNIPGTCICVYYLVWLEKMLHLQTYNHPKLQVQLYCIVVQIIYSFVILLRCEWVVGMGWVSFFYYYQSVEVDSCSMNYENMLQVLL